MKVIPVQISRLTAPPGNVLNNLINNLFIVLLVQLNFCEKLSNIREMKSPPPFLCRTRSLTVLIHRSTNGLRKH